MSFIKRPGPLVQDALCGLAIATGVVSLGSWAVLGAGWRPAGLLALQHVQRAPAAEATQAPSALAARPKPGIVWEESAPQGGPQPAPEPPLARLKAGPQAGMAAPAARPEQAAWPMKPAAARPPAEPPAGLPPRHEGVELAAAPDFPLAAPVRHGRRAQPSLPGWKDQLLADAPAGEGSRQEPGVATPRGVAVALVRAPLAAPRPAALSPALRAELLESRLAEAHEGLPRAEASAALLANGLPRQRLALRRRLQAEPLASAHTVPETVPVQQVSRFSAPVLVAGRGVAAGVVFHAFTVGARPPVPPLSVTPPSPLSGVQLGEPRYDATTRTLRLPLSGHVSAGPLRVYRLDNGRAYVDLAGASPGVSGTRFVSTSDGTFVKGAIAGRPDHNGTRLSFELGGHGAMNASIEGNALVIRATPGPAGLHTNLD